MDYSFIDIILLFAIYSFMGWVIETVFASTKAKRFVNRGFLSGPFCPIYGYGAIIIIQSVLVVNNVLEMSSLAYKIVCVGIAIGLASMLEYFTGALSENIFKLKLWDYGNEFLNIKGRICLKYSMIWGIMAYVLIEIIYPVLSQTIMLVPLPVKSLFGVFALLYLIFDTLKSINRALKLKQMMPVYCINHKEQIYKKIKKLCLTFIH